MNLKKTAVLMSCVLCATVSHLSNSEEKPLFLVEQLSYKTTCAEEDNVILKLSLMDDQVRGINISSKKPVFDKKEYEIFTDPDFTGCNWEMKNYESLNYYPKCPSGYLDQDQVCKPDFSGKILDQGDWVILGDRGTFWQPFMNFINQDGQSIGEYKTIYIKRRLENAEEGAEFPNIAAIYSDGYLRPSYSTRINEPGGWGGSFILGNSTPVKQNATYRHFNNIKQLKILKSDDKNLNLEVIFANQPDHPGRLIIHHRYDEKAIDFFPPANIGNALTFVSMYRDSASFDIEFLSVKRQGKEQVYNVMDPALHNTAFSSRIVLGKRTPAIHNTLAPDFELSGIDLK